MSGAPVESCRAPFVSLRLEPTGSVQACCVNDGYPLGSITETSLREIWRGARADRLREAMRQDDYALGCTSCGDAIAGGRRAQTLAVDYDHFSVPTDVAWPRHIEFALGNTCNLQCVQCSGELSSAIRSQREHRPPLPRVYDDAFFEDLRDFLPHLEAATFIGGEPFLMREARRVWDLLLELEAPPEVWVTTNGTVWDDRVVHYLHALRMGVSLSIDGVRPETIAGIRKGADAEALLANRDRFIAATRSYGRNMKLNYCVMVQNWEEYLPFLLQAEELGISVYAARVQEPAACSLYHLPPDDLRRVLDTLLHQGADEVDGLRVNRSAWDGTIADLTAHLTRIEAGPASARPPDSRSVLVGAPRRRAGGSASDLGRLRASLTEEGEAPPAHLTIEAGHVAAVESPGWADFLGLDDLIGLAADELLPAIEAQLGAELSPTPISGEESLQGRRYVLDRPGTAIELHSVALEDDAGRTHVLVGRVLPDAAGVP